MFVLLRDGEYVLRQGEEAMKKAAAFIVLWWCAWEYAVRVVPEVIGPGPIINPIDAVPVRICGTHEVYHDYRKGVHCFGKK